MTKTIWWNDRVLSKLARFESQRHSSSSDVLKLFLAGVGGYIVIQLKKQIVLNKVLIICN